MNHTSFKTVLFGYSKESVCEYIAGLSEEFCQKLVDALEDQERIQKELRERIQQLEQENQSFKKQQFDLADIMRDAADFAAGIRAKAEAENRELCRQNAEKAAKEEQRIRMYREKIDIQREEIRKILTAFDAELEAADERLKKLQKEYLQEFDME